MGQAARDRRRAGEHGQPARRDGHRPGLPGRLSCVAIGNYLGATAPTLALAMALALSGGRWRASQIAPPSDVATTDENVNVEGLACWARLRCVAVGSYTNTAGLTRPIAALSR